MAASDNSSTGVFKISSRRMIFSEPTTSSPAAPAAPAAAASPLSEISETPAGTAPPLSEKSPSRFKFLWVGTSHKQFTGYSRVSYAIMSQLAKTFASESDIEIHHYAFQGAKGLPDSYRPYPQHASPHVWDVTSSENPGKFAFGVEYFAEYLSNLQPNIVMIYNDPVIITSFLAEIIKPEAKYRGIVGLYLDLIYPMIQQKYVDILNRVDFIFTFTDYWRTVITRMGITRPIIGTLLHGFTPDDPHRIISRDSILNRIGVKSDDCVFLNLNRNLPRKRIDITMMAFAELCYMINRDVSLREKWGTRYYLLMGSEQSDKDGGWNQIEIFTNQLRRHGLSQSDIAQLSSRLKYLQNPMGNSDDAINELYNLADVGINTAEGEGFGLCSFEHGGLGKPQIAAAVGGLTDFLDNKCSILIEPVAEIYPDKSRVEVGAGCIEQLVNYRDVAKAMLFYLINPDIRKQHGEKLRRKIHENYTWEKTTRPLIDFIKACHSSSTHLISNTKS